MISVIVPVYNVEMYVGRCIESILEQTYEDLEIIIVNDGSTDKSMDVCAEYALKDKRIRLFSQKNLGVSAARNYGLSVARGSWVGFVDSDDFIEKTMYQNLLNCANKYEADIACCGVFSVDESGKKKSILKPSNTPDRIVCMSQKQVLENYFLGEDRFYCWAPWNKIFRKETLDTLAFEVDRAIAEDFYFNLQCVLKSNKIVYIPDEQYAYFLRSGSAVRTSFFSIKKYDDVYFSTKAVDLLNEKGIDEKIVCKAERHLILSAVRYILGYKRAKSFVDIESCKSKMHESKLVIDSYKKKLKQYNFSVKEILSILIAQFGV